MRIQEAIEYWKESLDEINYLEKKYPDQEWWEQKEATILAIEALREFYFKMEKAGGIYWDADYRLEYPRK